MNCDTAQSEVTYSVRTTVRLLGGKYRSVILWILRDGPKRFSEVHALVPEAREDDDEVADGAGG